jgi:hypothetical protein
MMTLRESAKRVWPGLEHDAKPRRVKRLKYRTHVSAQIESRDAHRGFPLVQPRPPSLTFRCRRTSRSGFQPDSDVAPTRARMEAGQQKARTTTREPPPAERERRRGGVEEGRSGGWSSGFSLGRLAGVVGKGVDE